MRYYYTIYTQVVNGIQEYIITDNMKDAIAARARGVFVLVGHSAAFPGNRRF